MAKQLIFILLFLLLVSIVIFGGYFISIKNTEVDNRIMNSIQDYKVSESIVVSNDNYLENNKELYIENKLDDSEESYESDGNNYRDKKVECYQDTDCGEDYEEESYCVFNKVYKKFHTYSCDGQCSNKLKNIFVEECLMGCSEGKCIDSFPFECSFDYDCGFNDFFGERYCLLDNNVHQYFLTWTCLNPDSENSQCKMDFEERLVDECTGNLICNEGMCVG
jgi:hypothetical protein